MYLQSQPAIAKDTVLLSILVGVLIVDYAIIIPYAAVQSCDSSSSSVVALSVLAAWVGAQLIFGLWYAARSRTIQSEQ